MRRGFAEDRFLLQAAGVQPTDIGLYHAPAQIDRERAKMVNHFLSTRQAKFLGLIAAGATIREVVSRRMKITMPLCFPASSIFIVQTH